MQTLLSHDPTQVIHHHPPALERKYKRRNKKKKNKKKKKKNKDFAVSTAQRVSSSERNCYQHIKQQRQVSGGIKQTDRQTDKTHI